MMKTVTKKNPMKMKRNSRKISDPVGEAAREKRQESQRMISKLQEEMIQKQRG
jgi:hypothetical protein